jgi:hypothetical protein
MDETSSNNLGENKKLILQNHKSKNILNENIDEFLKNDVLQDLENNDNDFLIHLDDDSDSNFLLIEKQKNEKFSYNNDKIIVDSKDNQNSENMDNTLNFDDTKKINEQDLIKINFIDNLLQNHELLKTIDEEALLAALKYSFEIRLYKKCVSLCL